MERIEYLTMVLTLSTALWIIFLLISEFLNNEQITLTEYTTLQHLTSKGMLQVLQEKVLQKYMSQRLLLTYMKRTQLT